MKLNARLTTIIEIRNPFEVLWKGKPLILFKVISIQFQLFNFLLLDKEYVLEYVMQHCTVRDLMQFSDHISIQDYNSPAKLIKWNSLKWVWINRFELLIFRNYCSILCDSWGIYKDTCVLIALALWRVLFPTTAMNYIHLVSNQNFLPWKSQCSRFYSIVFVWNISTWKTVGWTATCRYVKLLMLSWWEVNV